MNFQFDIPEIKQLVAVVSALQKEVQELRKVVAPLVVKKEKDKLLNSHQVKAMLGIGRTQLYSLECKGKIKYHRPNRGKKVYYQSDIQKYIDEMRKY